MLKTTKAEHPLSVTVYIHIGNSDNKLTQVDWAQYVQSVQTALKPWRSQRHEWFTPSYVPYQSAVWCITIDLAEVRDLKKQLANLTTVYGQDSIRWVQATDIVSLGSNR